MKTLLFVLLLSAAVQGQQDRQGHHGKTLTYKPRIFKKILERDSCVMLMNFDYIMPKKNKHVLIGNLDAVGKFCFRAIDSYCVARVCKADDSTWVVTEQVGMVEMGFFNKKHRWVPAIHYAK